MKDYLKIIEVYKLEDYFKDIFLYNKANEAPYHNFYHLVNTMRNCYKLAMGEKLNVKLRKNLLIAALFHDFDHSAGKLSDDKNIEEAIKGFQKYSKESKEDNNKIVDLIKATQYPYVIPDEDLNISQKIIRDADLMQCFADNFIQQIFIGFLQGEMHKEIKSGIEMQTKFIDNLKFYTETAKEILKNRKPGLLEDLNFLKKVLS